MSLAPGLSTSLEFVVTAEDTAARLRSGDLDVLATPRLLGWLEAATCAAVAEVIDAAHTTVGVEVSLRHHAPSPVGARVEVSARLTHVNARLLTFSVEALEPSSRTLIGSGTVIRAVVDRQRFLARLAR